MKLKGNKYPKFLGVFSTTVLVLILAGCASPGTDAALVERPPEVARAALPYAYVASAADGTVTALDLAADQVLWTLEIGERAAHGIAASPDIGTVYAGDAAAREVVVIDATRQEITQRIPLSTAVHGIDISPDGQTLWVGGSLDNDPVRGTLTVIDTASLAIEDVISPGLGSASHFAFTPDGKEIWIASTSTNLVWIVDTATRRVLATVPLTAPEAQQRPAPGDDWDEVLAERKIIGLNEVAISPDGRRAYAVGPTTSQLYAIDVQSRRVLKSVPAGERAHGVSVSPDGQEVWVADWAGAVNVFDAEGLELIASVQVAGPAGGTVQGANHVAFNHDGGRVYVSSINEVVVMDPAERQVLNRVPVGQEPHEFSLQGWIAADAWSEPVVIQAAAESAGVGSEDAALEAGDAAASVLTTSAAELTQVNDERSVTVTVTPLNLAGPGETMDFRVALDTHVVDLAYDLASIAVLRDAQGNEYAPLAWDGPRGGHHVNGVLKFDGRADILAAGSGYLELELQGVAGVPSRVFRWEIGR